LPSLQRKVKDLLQGVDDRMRKLEPQKISLDGRDFTADPDEKRQYEEANERPFGAASSCCGDGAVDIPGAISASGYNESAIFWLGMPTTASATSRTRSRPSVRS